VTFSPGRVAQLIALDIDGTLIDHGQPVSAAARAAVRTAVDRGDHVVLATGRTMTAARPIIAQLGLSEGYAVCGNGALVLDVAAGKPLHTTTFEPEPVLAAIERTLPGATFAGEDIGVGNRVTAAFADGLLTGAQTPVSLADLGSAPLVRLAAWWGSRTADEVVRAFDGVELPGAGHSIDHVEPWMLVVRKGLSKSVALEALRQELGVPAGATFAIGDGRNDVEMLRWAGHGVAMGQAPSEVRAAADEVTGTFGDDGLAAALTRFLARTS
jgi:hydroxymethylpyrimidine pyrophosphatase-like HAD family hydrolase